MELQFRSRGKIEIPTVSDSSLTVPVFDRGKKESFAEERSLRMSFPYPGRKRLQIQVTCNIARSKYINIK